MDIRTKIKEFLAREVTLKHLMGQHDQSLHGRRGGMPGKRNVAQLRRDYKAASNLLEKSGIDAYNARQSNLRDRNNLQSRIHKSQAGDVSKLKDGSYFGAQFGNKYAFFVKKGDKVYSVSNKGKFSPVKNPPKQGHQANQYVKSYLNWLKLDSKRQRAQAAFDQLSKELGDDVYG